MAKSALNLVLSWNSVFVSLPMSVLHLHTHSHAQKYTPNVDNNYNRFYYIVWTGEIILGVYVDGALARLSLLF